jgi:hypothetical protein
MTRWFRQHRTLIVLVAILAITAGGWACATTPLGKAIQTADAQKQLVEASAVEFAKLHLNGQISDELYAQGKAAYGKWAKGQTALAESLAAWKQIGDVASEKRLSEALKAIGPLARAYFEFLNMAAPGLLDRVKVKLSG